MSHQIILKVARFKEKVARLATLEKGFLLILMCFCWFIFSFFLLPFINPYFYVFSYLLLSYFELLLIAFLTFFLILIFVSIDIFLLLFSVFLYRFFPSVFFSFIVQVFFVQVSPFSLAAFASLFFVCANGGVCLFTFYLSFCLAVSLSFWSICFLLLFTRFSSFLPSYLFYTLFRLIGFFLLFFLSVCLFICLSVCLSVCVHLFLLFCRFLFSYHLFFCICFS